MARSQQTRTPAEWTPGAMVARYKLVAKLATGGMAEIWLADQAGSQGFKKPVVIKRILDSYSKNPDFVAMFIDEARIAAQLNHPNIVQIYDLGEHAGAYYIAMEYLPGESLSVIARTAKDANKHIPPPIAARLVAGAAAGLGHAHGKLGSDGKPLHVVHRDVSPQNIMVTLDGNAKVVDFGVARAANRATQTVDGQIKGKIAYMSPEQASGAVVDARTDVFALGIILFEAVTSSRYYPSPEMHQMLALLCGNGPLPRVRERDSQVPEGLAEIVDRATSRDPKARYADGDELHEALEEWLHHLPVKITLATVQGWLKELFGDQWGKRAELIESARSGQLTPSDLRRRLESGGDTNPTMPGHTPSVATISPVFTERRMVLRAVAAGIGTMLLVVGLAVGLFYRPRVTEPPSPPPAPAAAAGAAPASAPAAEAEPAQAPVAVAPAAAAPPRPAARPAPRPAPAPARGKLTLQTNPVTEVFLGARSLGETPLVEVPLPAGTQKLKLVNPATGASSFIEVDVVAGKTVMKKLRL